MMQRRNMLMFLRQHWRLLLFEEGIFTLAFLLFVCIRSFNPDLWHIYLGGEKPMELAFLNAILRSPYMPPLDPWFSGGYINYYYYGYVIIGTLIKLTGIIPTVAFNLAIPTLFALTFSAVTVIVYSFTRHISFSLLGGYFAALIGNFDGFIQLKGQLLSLLTQRQPATFDYWQSSRIIPFTINEFPFWSFLFADLHPHVIDMPIAVFMLGIIAAFMLSKNGEETSSREYRRENNLLYLLAAFIFGTIACVNPWDMPVYALLLATVLLVQQFLQKRQGTKLELLIALGFRTVTAVCIFVCGYLFYLPFYANYQQLYVNGVGLVKVGSGLSDFLTIFGLWLFLATCFFLTELYGYLWVGYLGRWTWHSKMVTGNLYIFGYVLLSVVALVVCMLFGLKIVLAALLMLGAGLFIRSLLSQRILLPGTRVIAKNSVSDWTYTNYTYLLLFMGLCICLGTEFVYIRDFLDGGDYARMNTVFKFSLQAWFCFAIGGALVVYRLWYTLSGFVKRVWSIVLIVFVVACSVFLSEGVAARIQDHQFWIDTQTPQFSANYTPTLDGFAFAHAWYPEDANALAWLNADVAGSPVILEAAAPVSYQWFNRVSVYTGLPDVLGWPDHVGEQRYDYQPDNRVADIGLIYTTTDSAQSLELLRYYHVHYIYVGPLEKQLYAQQTSAGLDKFDRMVGDTLRIAYRADNVTIYEMI